MLYIILSHLDLLAFFSVSLFTDFWAPQVLQRLSSLTDNPTRVSSSLIWCPIDFGFVPNLSKKVSKLLFTDSNRWGLLHKDKDLVVLNRIINHAIVDLDRETDWFGYMIFLACEDKDLIVFNRIINHAIVDLDRETDWFGYMIFLACEVI